MTYLNEWQAAEAIGEKVLDMIDRLKNVDAVAPGTQADLRFEVDGVEYDLAVKVARAPTGGAK